MHARRGSAAAISAGRRCVPGRRLLCDATAGLGVLIEVDGGVSRTTLMKTMMAHIDMPGRFTPGIRHCAVRAATGPAADEGGLWRSLTFDNGDTVAEHAYASPADGEIRFVRLDGSHDEGVLEVVHALYKAPLRIEHYQRDRTTLERVPWSEPRARVAAAIEETVRLARAAEAEASDATFHPKEFPS